MIKKARTMFKLFLEVEETLPDKDFQNQGKGTTQNGTSEARNFTFSGMQALTTAKVAGQGVDMNDKIADQYIVPEKSDTSPQ